MHQIFAKELSLHERDLFGFQIRDAKLKLTTETFRSVVWFLIIHSLLHIDKVKIECACRENTYKTFYL